jgi:hypothetical protein
MMCMISWIRAVSNQFVALKGDVLVSEFVTTLSYPFHPEQNPLKDLGEKSVYLMRLPIKSIAPPQARG